VNFLGLLNLLRFGSGWRSELSASAGNSGSSCDGDTAADLSLRGLFSLFVGGRALDADALQTLTEFQIGTAYGLHLQRDMPHATLPCVTLAQDTPARPFLKATHALLEDTGRRLWERQSKSLGAFILSYCESASSAPPSAAALIAALARAFPGFNDQGCGVAFHSKAARLVNDLHRRYAAEDARFAFEDIDSVSASCDAQLVAALRRCGAIRVAPGALAAKMEAGGGLAGGSPEESLLRAAAMVAVKRIAAQAGYRAAVVAHWLAQGGGGGDTEMPEHVCKTTQAY